MKCGRIVHLSLATLFICALSACTTKAPGQPAKVYERTGFTAPGTYRLQIKLDGRGSLADQLLSEKARNPAFRDVDMASLHKLFRNAFSQLYFPVQPGAPLCHMETNFRHCRGIELLADFRVYTDDTIVLHSSVLYHVTIRIEKDQPNFFRAIKTQRDRGDFALPRRYYAGELAQAIQQSLPILQEIAADYRKYIKDGNRDIEIDLVLEVAREKEQAVRTDMEREDVAGLSAGMLLSALPNMAFLTSLTVSALSTGGHTFWNVLEEKKEFDLYKRALELEKVEYSYGRSMGRNAFRTFRRMAEPSPDIILRDLKIRLRAKKPQMQEPAVPESGKAEGRIEGR